jgi:DNA-directed RNA polymerase specialized sigma subunit
MAKKADPVDTFIKEAADLNPAAQRRYAELRGRRTKELELWHHWNDNGRKPEHMEPLLKSIKPLIKSEATKRMQGLGGSMPKAALEGELQNAAVKAINSYKPDKGTQLSTHVTGNFMRITDSVNEARNLRYMPRDDSERYGTFHNARTELHEELGRQPTTEELATKLPGWTPKRIKKMERGFGAEVFTDMGTEFDGDAASLSPHDAFQLMKSQMTPEQQRFGELHFDPNGKKPSITVIAKRLNVSTHRAYRIKAEVEKRVGGVLKGE